MDQSETNTNPAFQQLTMKMRPLISHTADVICRTYITTLLEKPVQYISRENMGF